MPLDPAGGLGWSTLKRVVSKQLRAESDSAGKGQGLLRATPGISGVWLSVRVSKLLEEPCSARFAVWGSSSMALWIMSCILLPLAAEVVQACGNTAAPLKASKEHTSLR